MLRVAVVYCAAVFAVIEFADIVFPRIGLPDWTITAVLGVGLVGLAIAVVLAWGFEVQLDGASERAPGTVQWLSWRAIAAAVLLVALGVGAGRWWAMPGEGEARAAVGSLAVLPLNNLSGNPAEQYFVDGMTESLIAELARVGSLRVISRTSTWAYKDTRKGLREIAEELGVDAVIEGSVIREGDRVRVIAQLIEVETDSHLWSGQYDRDVRDILTLQSEMAAVIARKVHAELTPADEQRFSAAQQADPAAHDAYLKGLYFAQKHTVPASLRARDHFNDAMQIDPGYPLPYAGLADALSCSPLHTWVIPAEGPAAVPMAVMDRAQELADRAIELDEDLPEAQTAMALVSVFRHYDWDEADRRYRQALEINPSYEFAHRSAGFIRALQGRFDEAVAAIELARKYDPLSAAVATLAGDIYAWKGDTDTALLRWKEANALDPADPLGYAGMAVVLCQQGRSDEALKLFDRALELSGDDPLLVSDLAHCHATAGRPEEARRLLAGLEARSTEIWVSPVGLGLVHLGLGEHDAALAQLERGYELHTYRILWLAVDRRWDPVRDDPRFQSVLRRIGLAES